MQTTPLSSILLLASPSSVATILFFIIFLTTLVYVLKGEIKKGLDIKDPPTDGQRLFADRDFVLDLKKIIIEEGGSVVTIAKNWKNGVVSNLTNGQNGSEANAIYVN
ncbi:MAG: hypothetical protein ACKO41_01045, partial [Sphingomonadales bacterium]